MYQVLWLRMLGLVFGVTVHAASTVLASFMAGLAIGSYAAGRLADRIARPLLWFAAAEALVGFSALATPTALELLQRAYASVHGSLAPSPAAVTSIRFLMAFGVLIVPTALMGATLPLVLKSSMARGAFGRNAGFLYAANTAGAIAGTLGAGLYLIPYLGMRQSFVAAASANLAVAAVACVVGLRQRVPVRAARTEDTALAGHGPGRALAVAEDYVERRTRRAVLVVFALSGFTSLALEVIWFRVNVLVLRPTVYAFAIMLSAVLAGIALGSAAVAPLLPRRRNWLGALIALEICIAVAVLLSFYGLQIAPTLTERVVPSLERVMPGYLIPIAVASAVTIVPSMVLLGAAFPVGLQLWVAGQGGATGHSAERVGLFYSLNLCGAIAGSLAAGFVLIPWFGARTSLIAVSTLIYASALALIAVWRASTARRLRAAVAGGAVVAVAAVATPDPFHVFLTQRFPDQPIVWHEEGMQTTVSVHRHGADASAPLTMYLDGLHQASTARTTAHVHHRIGHLAMALHPHVKSALVVGLGGGATAGAISRHPYAQVDVVELSSSVVRGAEHFTSINYGVLKRPNVRLRVDDGRNYLMVGSHRYDAVTADLIQPIHAGAANVYSAEYFRLVRRGLSPGGIAVQWVFGTDAEYRMIMRTFLSVFSHVTLWAEGSLLVGGMQPLALSRSDFDWKLQIPETREALATVGIGSFDDLLRLYTAGDAQLRRFAGHGPLITDDKPIVEYFLALERKPLDITNLRGDVTEIVK